MRFIYRGQRLFVYIYIFLKIQSVYWSIQYSVEAHHWMANVSRM